MTDTVAAPPTPLVAASDREMSETTNGRKVAALVTVCASLMVITLDVTILNVALPTLALELRASNSALQRPIEARPSPASSTLSDHGRPDGAARRSCSTGGCRPPKVCASPHTLRAGRGAWTGEVTDMGGAAASPLVEIERAAQVRAKDISLEMTAPGGEVKLRALIADEVARWNDDHRRGRRAFALPDPELVVKRAFRNLARYGPLTALLADEDVWEVMVNAPDAVFVRRHRGPSGYHDEVFHDDDHVVRVLTKLLDDASSAHRSLDPAEGLQDAQLDDGARVHVVHGDIARGGHVLVNIRKFTGIPFRSLGELVERDMLSGQVADLVAACVRARLSIVFAGPPGSGKTTLLSCATAELDPSLRVVVAEEVFESDIPVPNVAQMQTRAPRADRPGVDLRRLVAGFLRMAPDVAVVGEVRDREALPLLLTLSSGVTGYTTIHAGSARQALTRLRFICQLADTSGGLPLAALNSLVSESVDVVVQCTRTVSGPRVTEVVMVEDLAGAADATHFTVTEVFRRSGPDQALAWTGDVPARGARALADAGFELRALLEGRGGPG